MNVASKVCWVCASEYKAHMPSHLYIHNTIHLTHNISKATKSHIQFILYRMKIIMNFPMRNPAEWLKYTQIKRHKEQKAWQIYYSLARYH